MADHYRIGNYATSDPSNLIDVRVNPTGGSGNFIISMARIDGSTLGAKTAYTVPASTNLRPIMCYIMSDNQQPFYCAFGFSAGAVGFSSHTPSGGKDWIGEAWTNYPSNSSQKWGVTLNPHTSVQGRYHNKIFYDEVCLLAHPVALSSAGIAGLHVFANYYTGAIQDTIVGLVFKAEAA